MNPIASTGSVTSPDQITSFVQQKLNAPERNGRLNLFQMVDQLTISPQAKQQVEQSMAQDMLSQQSSGSAPLRHAQHDGEAAAIADGAGYGDGAAHRLHQIAHNR